MRRPTPAAARSAPRLCGRSRFSVQNAPGVTIDPGVSPLYVYRINAFYGAVTTPTRSQSATPMPIALVIQRGATGIPFAAGSLDTAPTFNVGSRRADRWSTPSRRRPVTTGPEIPATRSVLSIQIINPTGVTLAGGELTSTGTDARRLLLSAGTLTTSCVQPADPDRRTRPAPSPAARRPPGSTGRWRARCPRASSRAAPTPSRSARAPSRCFELVNPTTNAGGTVDVQAEAFDVDSGGTAGVGFDAINNNRYWSAQITSGAANFTNTTVRLTEQGTVAANAIGQSATQRPAPTTRSAAPSPAPRSARATRSPRWATSPSAGSPARPPSAAPSPLAPAATTHPDGGGRRL